jgi:hypothetical protein
MSKTVGGSGIGQHKTEGVGKGVKSPPERKTPDSESTPGSLVRECDLHHTQFGEISIDQDALRDVKWQIENSTYEPAESCVRLHR